MSRYDTLVSAAAWDELAATYNEAGGEDADDHTLAEMLREAMIRVEG